MNRRGVGVVALAMVLVVAASGCSLREVQLWFQFNKHQAISRDQARSLADLVNSKRAPGRCDGNYVGSCVPDNATQVHCAGTDGAGPEVRGPLTVRGWDSFELDADGDRQACVDPVGTLDTFGQEFDGIAVRGWAFDPNTTDPINLDVYDDGVGSRQLADEERSDLASRFPGVGVQHGFDLFAGADVGETRRVCVFGINVGAGSNTLLQCKTITMQDVSEVRANNQTVYGMIEGADQVPGGIHVRGFFVPIGASMPVGLFTRDGGEGPGIHLTRLRDDVAVAVGAPTGVAYGFDEVVPATIRLQSGTANPFSAGICLRAGVVYPGTQVACRNLDT